jgi:hypothetical protein
MSWEKRRLRVGLFFTVSLARRVRSSRLAIATIRLLAQYAYDEAIDWQATTTQVPVLYFGGVLRTS